MVGIVAARDRGGVGEPVERLREEQRRDGRIGAERGKQQCPGSVRTRARDVHASRGEIARERLEAGARGIVLSANGAGTIDLTTGGTVIGTVGDGINTTAATGATTITTNDTVDGAEDGIDAQSAGGAEARMYAWILAAGLLGWALNGILQTVERRTLHWHTSFREVVR